MAAMNPDLSFSDQLKKLKFEELAKNSRKLSDSFARTSRISNNMMLQMIANLNAMKAQNSAIRLQMKSDQAELRLKQQRLRLVNDQIKTLQTEIRNQKAVAESILTSGPKPRESMAKWSKRLDAALTEVDKLKGNYRKLLPKKMLLPVQIEGLGNSINAATLSIKGFPLEGISIAFEQFAQTARVVSDAMMNLVQGIYQLQQDLNVQMGSATQLYIAAMKSSFASYFTTGKPILDPKDILSVVSSYKKEFGTILAPEEAERIAIETKRLGVSAEIYSRAKRAFLGTGSAETSRMVAMNEFAKQGLSAGSAIQFAAENANLVAIAGEKYAESLFRAAAESQRIGVSLNDVEKFANSVVGDFESTLVNFAELSAMGVDLDLVKVAATAQFGTPEDMQNVLKEQFSLAGITGEELQRNRTLRLALTQTTGFDEATILRFTGVAQAPTERTVQEQQLDKLSTIVELLSKVSRVVSIVTQLAVGAVAGALAGGFIGGLPGALIGGTLGLVSSLGTAMKSATGYAQGGLVRGSKTSTSSSISASSNKVERAEKAKYALTATELSEAALQRGAVKDLARGGIRPNINLIRDVKTPFGTIGKSSPLLLKYAAQNTKFVPILGAVLGGGLTGYQEYIKTGNMGRSVSKGVTSMLGGAVGSVLAAAGSYGNPIAAALGGALGSNVAEELFDMVFPRKMKDGGLVTPRKPPIHRITPPKPPPQVPVPPDIIYETSPLNPKTFLDSAVTATRTSPVKFTRADYEQRVASTPIIGPMYRAIMEQSYKDAGYTNLSGIFEGTRAAAYEPYHPASGFYPGGGVFMPAHHGDIKTPTDSDTRETLMHELFHVRDFYELGLPRKMLELPQEEKAKRLAADPNQLKLRTYGAANIREAYAVAGQQAFRLIERYKHIDRAAARSPVNQLVRNKILGILAKYEEDQPGTGTVLLDLLEQEQYKDSYLRDLLITNVGRPKPPARPPRRNDKPRTIQVPVVKKHAGGFVHGSGEVPAMLKGGEYVVNPKSTNEYGTDFLNNVNNGAYTKPTRIIDNDVSVNNDALKGELRQIISTMRDMRIEMSGYDVGNVSANESRSPLRTL